VSIIGTFIHNSSPHSLFVSFSSILTNRLVLNLKQAGNSSMRHEASSLPSLDFATNSFVGNLGAPFRASNEDDENNELEDLNNDEHELQELNREGQAALIAEEA
jgi:hypothetical protein